MNSKLLLGLLLCLPAFLSAQIGGDDVYTFLNLSNSARITALGGNLITVRDDDVNLAYNNPAALNSLMDKSIAFNHNLRLAGIQNGYLGYGHHVNPWNTTFHGGVQYITYGDFVGADIFGNEEATFDAAEYAITLGAGRQLNERIAAGANLKMISSQFESYNSTGLVGDLSLMYFDTSKMSNFTFLIKNIGGQLTSYREENRETTPFDIQIGYSKRLRHLPFRFSIIYHNLQRWNILYDDPNLTESNPLFGNSDEQNEVGVFFDNLARHLIFNGEFLFGKKENFRLRFAYNHLKHAELTPDNIRSLAGFSFGLGIRVFKFRIDYGREIVHLAGNTNHFSISTNINEFRR